jgi:hypothetical protein
MVFAANAGWRGRLVDRNALLATMAICLLLACGIAPLPTAAREAGASDPGHYDMEISFDPEDRTLAGAMDVAWTNTTGQPQDTLYFRLYPNAAHYADGAMDVMSVAVDGAGVEAEPWPDPTVLEVPLGKAMAPGDETMLSLAFETVIPATSGASFGILGGDAGAGWWLADWYPILAGWEDGEGWYLDPPTAFGDPTFAESATYTLTLTAPARYLVLGSGMEADRNVDAATGEAATVIETSPGRDLTLSLLPDMPGEEPITLRDEGAGTMIRVTLPPELAIPGLAEAIAGIARETLPLYAAWLGDYPDSELDITAVPLAGATGVSWSGIVWLDLARIAEDGQLSPAEEASLRFVLAHELSHQWISGVIGSNNNDHGFLSEGLANALAILAIRETQGTAEARACLRECVAAGYRMMVEGGNDGVADAPITDETDIAARGRLIYGKAALGFEAIRQAIGDDAFLAGLAAYAAEFRFGISEPADLLAAFELAAGVDLDALWDTWFLDDRTTLADIDAVLDGFSAANSLP